MVNPLPLSYTKVEGEEYESMSPNFQIISSSNPKIASGSTKLSDLLLSVDLTNARPQRTLLRVVGKGSFMIWLSSVTESSAWTLQDGLSYTEKFFNQHKEVSTTFLYTVHDEKNDSVSTCLISILSLCSQTSDSVLTSFQDRHTLEDEFTPTNWIDKSFAALSRSRVLLAITLLIILTSVTVVFMTSRHHSKEIPDYVWLHWNTDGSEGPRNQLQFTRPWLNFSEWASTYGQEDQEWYLRLDDQSMVPAHLVSDTDRHYQQWYARRYPELESIRSSNDYLNASFYEDPMHTGIETDRFFHPSHCVVAFRRYWEAKETGKHVCPSDLDHDHIKHCFDSMDDFLFFEGERGTEPVLREDQKTFTLAWLPNACF